MKSEQTLLTRFADKLFSTATDRQRFLRAMEESRADKIALIRAQGPGKEDPEGSRDTLDWLGIAGITVVDSVSQPGKSPEHERGDFYCMDLSSAVLGSVLKEASTRGLADNRGTLPPILDLCASPGGKTALCRLLFADNFLVSNEVIGSRLPALLSNMSRLRLQNVGVANRPVQFWRTATPDLFAAVVVDAPCSGQSLAIKNPRVRGSFHSHLIEGNVKRQRGLLVNAAQCVRPGGYLAYITCTYARQENEGVIEWFLRRVPDFAPIAVPHLASQQSELTSTSCYRVWPWQGLGAGGFAALFRRTPPPSTDTPAEVILPANLQFLWSSR